MANDILENSQTSKIDSIQPYIQLLWQWAWLIVLTGLIAGVAAYYSSSRMTPTFQATTRLLVNQPPAAVWQNLNSSSIVSSSNTTQTYSEMLKDLPVLQQVVGKLQIPVDPIKLKEAIGVSIIPDTQLIEVTVKDTDPNRAAAIANTLGGVFSERIQSLQSARYALSKENLQKQLNDMETQLQLVNDQLLATTDPQEKDRLETKQSQYRQIYSSLVSSFEQVRLAEAQTSINVIQVEPASIPTLPISPRTQQNTILAAIIGMLAAIGMVFAFQFLDDTVRDPEELARQLGLPILGVIPYHDNKDETPITQAQPRSPVSEAFRALRTNVEYAKAGRNLHRLIITSPLPGDGKSTVIINLAIVMAQRGLRTVLVDCDMRRPNLHAILGMKNHNGLSNLFLQPVLHLESYVQPTLLKDLSLLSSGPLPPNPAELLASTRMADILEHLSQQNDMILVDTPPSLVVTDAAVLSPLVDGILIVISAGKTKTNAVKRIVAGLRQVEAKPIGIVINNVRFTRSGYSYYYRSYYYRNDNYYSDDGKSRLKNKQTPSKGRKKEETS
jgi:succinoglycan biosynthesis transport protein ExoP